jgi:hypothetical protein
MLGIQPLLGWCLMKLTRLSDPSHSVSRCSRTRFGDAALWGVLRDAPDQGLIEPIAPAMYYPYTAALSDIALLVVRTKKNATAADDRLRMAVSRGHCLPVSPPAGHQRSIPSPRCETSRKSDEANRER